MDAIIHLLYFLYTVQHAYVLRQNIIKDDSLKAQKQQLEASDDLSLKHTRALTHHQTASYSHACQINR